MATPPWPSCPHPAPRNYVVNACLYIVYLLLFKNANKRVNNKAAPLSKARTNQYLSLAVIFYGGKVYFLNKYPSAFLIFHTYLIGFCCALQGQLLMPIYTRNSLMCLNLPEVFIFFFFFFNCGIQYTTFLLLSNKQQNQRISQ